MKNIRLRFAAVSSLLAVLFFAAPVWADSVDERIEALKAKIAALKAQQMEFKKEATAAAAALPTFTYRPGSGVTWAAADRSWSWRMGLLFQMHMYNHTDGNDARGATTGDLFSRRFRPNFTFCVSDCLYEWVLVMDFDTGDVGQVQNTGLWIRFSKINPWLPDIAVGDEITPITFGFVTRSSTSSAQVELASNLVDSGLTGAKLSRRTIGLAWLDKPTLLTPGDFSLVAEYQIGAGISENRTSDTDRKQFVGTIGSRPFSRSKNRWLDRLKLGMSAAVTSVDSRSLQQGRRFRIRTDERVGRFALLDTGGVTTTTGIGDGLAYEFQGGFEWGIGPYLSRVELGINRFESGRVGATAGSGFSNVRGGYWRIGHELFVWSPKGLLTGRAFQPGSVQVGWGFQRAEANCGFGQDCSPGTGAVNNVRLLKRELDLWYHWNTFSRIGLFWNWWDADNVPQATQVAVGCSRNTGVRTGKDCDWHTVNLALQVNF